VFAFPAQRKEPLLDAARVRNAIARFDQVEGVTDAERDVAWARIRIAAYRFGVELSKADWRVPGTPPKSVAARSLPLGEMAVRGSRASARRGRLVPLH
jgi:hypothetical protein